MARERGSGVTPPIVVELLTKEVSEKSMLAVSKATGIGLAAIGRYLKGVGEPTTKTLQKLSDYFGVSVPFLRGEVPFNDYKSMGQDHDLLIHEFQLLHKADIAQGVLSEDLDQAEAAYNLFEEFQNLINIFVQIPVERMSDAIEVLLEVKETLEERKDGEVTPPPAATE